MSIKDSQDLFFATFHHILPERSGPGPLGPVRKISVVRSGPEGPQFARSVGTLHLFMRKEKGVLPRFAHTDDSLTLA